MFSVVYMMGRGGEREVGVQGRIGEGERNRERGRAVIKTVTFIFLSHLSLTFHFSLEIFLVDDNDVEVLPRFS